MSRKKKLKYYNFWGDVPADFLTAGNSYLRPPAFDAHGVMLICRNRFAQWLISNEKRCSLPVIPLPGRYRTYRSTFIIKLVPRLYRNYHVSCGSAYHFLDAANTTVQSPILHTYRVFH